MPRNKGRDGSLYWRLGESVMEDSWEMILQLILKARNQSIRNQSSRWAVGVRDF